MFANYVGKYGSKKSGKKANFVVWESPFPVVEDDGQTTRQEKVLNEAVNVGDAQEVADTESVDVPREVAEKARRNIVPSQSVSCEQAGAANNVLDPPIDSVARASPIVSPGFEGATEVNNNSLVAPLRSRK
ncbi:hypothetical protein F0562_007304 [Nyssa sinensis]|uniref:Uncharacterized protein n=1 Tax=Nyssa sinensis TaxID=561372 RepID=A0A5J5A4P0_9ASTE|nr:hypothetical protein F0562_007304 [Nyssa sinensis]